MLKKYLLVFGAVLVLAVGTAACSNLTGEDGSGQLVMELADKPVNDVDKVLVNIERVEVNREESGWEVLNDFSDSDNGYEKFDLMKLRFDEKLLGDEMLPSGNYNQIRLIVAADEHDKDKDGVKKHDNFSMKSKVVYNNGEEDNLVIPSGPQTGLKIDHEFEVEEDVITELLLDADVSEIMKETGSGFVILSPTAIDVVDKVNSGNIKGRVLKETEGDPEPITDQDVKIVVKEGKTEKSTVAVNDDDSGSDAGSFLLRGLEPDTYTLEIYTVDDDGNTDDYEKTEVEDIKVEAEKTEELEEDIILSSN